MTAKRLQNIKKKTPQFRQIRKTLYKKYTPEVNLELSFKRRDNGEIRVVNSTVNPKSQFPPHLYEPMYEIATVKVNLIMNTKNSTFYYVIFHVPIKIKFSLKNYLHSSSFQSSDIVAIHEDKCPSFEEKKIQLSCDGVHENKSTSVSIDVYSWNFKNCKAIYPHKLVRPLNKYKVDDKITLREVVHDVSSNHLRIMQYIADKLKRSTAKDCKSHSSWFACEYCFAKGTKIVVSDNENAKKKINEQINVIEEKITECQTEHFTPVTASKIQNLTSLKKELKKVLML